MRSFVFFFALFVFAVSCSDADSGVTRLEGTAAIGAPLQGTVYLKNESGTVSLTTTDPAGRYVMPEGHGYPALLMVEGRANGAGPLVRLYSWASGPGNLNITPATHAIVSLALQGDPAAVLPAEQMKTGGTVPVDAFTNLGARSVRAAARIREILAPLLSVTAGDFDLLHGRFQANGQGFDLFLDCIHISVSNNLIFLTNAIDNTLIVSLSNTIGDLDDPANFTNAAGALTNVTVQLTNQVADTVPPVICLTNTEMRVVDYSNNFITIEWPVSLDDVTAMQSLRYRVYYSLSSNIGTAAGLAANGSVLREWTAGLYRCTMTNVVPDTEYFFNVEVKDLAGNRTVYNGLSQRTLPGGDVTPPVPGSFFHWNTNYASPLIKFEWDPANDTSSTNAILEYKLVTAPYDWLIDTVAEAESCTNVIYDWRTFSSTTCMHTNNVSGWFGLLVRDPAGNTAIYPPIHWAP